jgi:tripartite-type tricarboxylate transporter receptor subunit TctC
MRTRILTAALMAVALAGALATPAAAQAWPAKPIRLIVPFPPGGSTDVLARTLAQPLSAALGQPVVIDNRPGAAGNIGTAIAAKAPADGYTWLWCANTCVTNPMLYRDSGYETLKDLQPLAMIAGSPQVVVLHPGVAAGSIAELIALARAKPGALNFGSSGNGSTGHLAVEMFKGRTGVQIEHIGYKGAAPAMADLIAGQVQGIFETMTTAVPHLRSGKIKGIAVTSATRHPALPDLPTVGETVPGYEFAIWHSLILPTGTPPAVVERLTAEISAAMKLPEVRERLVAVGTQPFPDHSPGYAAAFFRADQQRLEPVVRQSNIRIE